MNEFARTCACSVHKPQKRVAPHPSNVHRETDEKLSHSHGYSKYPSRLLVFDSCSTSAASSRRHCNKPAATSTAPPCHCPRLSDRTANETAARTAPGGGLRKCPRYDQRAHHEAPPPRRHHQLSRQFWWPPEPSPTCGQ